MKNGKGRFISALVTGGIALILFVAYALLYGVTLNGVLSSGGIDAAAKVLVGIVYMAIFGIPQLIFAAISFGLSLSAVSKTYGKSHALIIAAAIVNAVTFVAAIIMFASLYFIK